MTYQAINFGKEFALFHEQYVGWVERSETHHPAKVKAMGFAMLNPSYGHHANVGARRRDRDGKPMACTS